MGHAARVSRDRASATVDAKAPDRTTAYKQLKVGVDQAVAFLKKQGIKAEEIEPQSANFRQEFEVQYTGVGPARVRGMGRLRFFATSTDQSARTPIPVEHVGGYPSIQRLLRRAALTFTADARAFGVDEAKGLLLVGLPGCGKDTIKKAASALLGRALLDLDLGAVMGEGGGLIDLPHADTPLVFVSPTGLAFGLLPGPPSLLGVSIAHIGATCGFLGPGPYLLRKLGLL